MPAIGLDAAWPIENGWLGMWGYVELAMGVYRVLDMLLIELPAPGYW